MSVTPRQVKNKKDEFGNRTGKPGTVYDVAIKYKTVTGWVPYMKRGFLTEDEANLHEAQMRIALKENSSFIAQKSNGKQLTKDFMLQELDRKKLRTNTRRGYLSNITVHINPAIGEVPINQVTPKMLDDLYDKMEENGSAINTIKYVHRTISSCFDGAVYWKWIEENPCNGVRRTFPSQKKKSYKPYNIKEVQQLLAGSIGTVWEFRVILAGLYGMRLSEIIGLREIYVDLDVNSFMVYEQLPQLKSGENKLIMLSNPDQMAPLKSSDRELPITAFTKPYFERALHVMEKQKLFSQLAGTPYYENNLVTCRADGSPFNQKQLSKDWGSFLRSIGLRHIRFHDLRHTTASNIYNLTGDFFGIAAILGHSVDALAEDLGINSPKATTERYIEINMDRKRKLLETYFKALNEVMVEDTSQKAKYRSRLDNAK